MSGLEVLATITGAGLAGLAVTLAWTVRQLGQTRERVARLEGQFNGRE